MKQYRFFSRNSNSRMKLAAAALAALLIALQSGCSSNSVVEPTIVTHVTTAADTTGAAAATTTAAPTTAATTTTAAPTTAKPATTTAKPTTAKPATIAATTAAPATHAPTPAATAAPVTTAAPQVLQPNAGSTSRYGYLALSEAQRMLYAEISNGIANFQKDISFATQLSEKQFLHTYYTVIADNPLFYYLPMNFSYAMRGSVVVELTNLTYNFTQAEVTGFNAQIDARTNEILGKLTAGMATVDKVRLIHDEIILHCAYIDSTYHSQDLYGALVGGQAICEGYAEAFQYVCEKAGIEAIIIVGATNGNPPEPHEWNMVKLDGDWYQMDLTWDDPIGAPSDTIVYDYFNVTDSFITGSRIIYDTFDHLGVAESNPYALPTATATKYSYKNYYGG